jgi:hypothetical protein
VATVSRRFAEAQPEPEYVLAIVQDHGPGDGGWGPATIMGTSIPVPTPAISTRVTPRNVEWFRQLARQLANETGKPTKVVRYRRDEELLSIGGSS